MDEKITFRGVEYPVRIVDIPGYGKRRVSTRSLEKALLTKDDVWVDRKAREVDCSIYFYVPDKLIEENEDKVATYVFKEVDGAGF